ncbi:MarR family transcriptional regulator [Aliarcobacter trophiarum LMG 25534]|uniref:MarR family transcriptional regulator n=1 Tax=Aliarcobacter trophiarum LMG 25534 TaxID=1032241 RepID=A0AAD0VMQ2_9BACT|nr:MarR family transcriptional regulator [Aliarcobacter trophiarum]AXK49141.1 transcriptional regulator, MarR family [Aliarcobacter trophiarum LMG 25534]RXI26395.1 MarR family transcriptional regulator [Aliarcobacter trophiarum]RXJ89840.1 MarR family transcriptional regulator [Aliarcobacter trophiarum LMG 25534]
MKKQHIEEFYKQVEQNNCNDIFALSLPMLLINKYLHNSQESFFKTKYDLLHSDIDVLAALYFANNEHTLTPTELYDATVFSSGGMTKVLKKLQERELILKQSSKKDKRSQEVSLSQKGEELIVEGIELSSKKLKDTFCVLKEKEQKELKKILQKLLFSMI